MKENKLKVVIKKPAVKVFEFTTDPKNTHLWIPQIKKELSDTYPPKIGTKYKNRGKDSKWTFYKVIELKENKTFTLTDSNKTYFVRYTYKKIDENTTEMEYYEWVKEGDLENPFTKDTLDKLKEVMENK